jgi:NitT/TauT family transport system substrate-binding protein
MSHHQRFGGTATQVLVSAALDLVSSAGGAAGVPEGPARQATPILQEDVSMADVLRVTAPGSGVAYYPQFIAHEQGFFAEEGLAVQIESRGRGPWIAQALASQEADVALGGIWRPLIYRDRLMTFRAFAQLCMRCPDVLVSRRPVERFRWTDLHGRSVLIPDGAPGGWMLLFTVLIENGVDVSRVRFIQHLHAEEATALFRAGMADFYLIEPPVCDVLVEDGFHSAATLAEAGGRVPWSVYYVPPDFLETRGDVAVRFGRAIRRGLEWTLSHEPEEAPGVFRQYFPRLDPDLVARSVRWCRDRGLWAQDIRLREDDLERWQAIIVRYGLMDRPIAYAEVFDVGPARAVERG